MVNTAKWKGHTLDFLCGFVVGVENGTLPGDVEVGLDGHVG